MRAPLLKQLQACLEKRLVVVRAPAGYGKTTLLSQWSHSISGSDIHVAWCSLDSGDDNEAQFFTYLVAAMQAADCNVGDGALAIYRPGASDAAKAFVATLVNELETSDQEVYLILDDFQSIKDVRIIQAMRELLHYAPRNLHIVIGSRSLPDLGLVELEVEEKATVINADSLRFSVDEARQFLTSRLSAPLDDDESQRLFDCTEGWPAGLQLAAISINKGIAFHPGDTGIRSGENELDVYFANAVLDRFSGEVRDFLLKTSILPRFDASLADAILQRSDSDAVLRRLDQSNVFLIRLSGDGGWYKYHPLFGEFLRARLNAQHPDLVPDLHQAASRWSAEHGQIVDAVQYALAAGQAIRAAELVESCALSMVQYGDIRASVSLLDRLPQEELEARPILKVAQSWSLALSNRPQRARQLLDEAGSGAGLDPSLLENLQVVRALCAHYEGDTNTCARIITDWNARSQKTDPFLTSVGCNLLSLVHSHAGRYELAREALVTPRKWTEEERSFYACCYANSLLAYSYTRRGYMKVAEPVLRSEIQRSNQRAGRRSAPACTAASFYAEVLYETDQFESLKDLLADRLDVIDEVALPEAMLATYRAKSRMLRCEGELAAAQAVLERLQMRAEERSHFHVLACCLAERIVLHLSLDEGGTARDLSDRLARLIGQPDVSEKVCTAELELVQAFSRLRLRIHEARWQDALALIDTMAAPLALQDRHFEIIRLEISRCRCLSETGHQEEAGLLLRQQLRQGEHLGVVRVFADEWPGGKTAIERTDRSGSGWVSPQYFDRVLNSFDPKDVAKPQPRPVFQPVFTGSGLLEALTDKEIRVLRLLSQGMQNKQISGTLHITVNTVKWHLKNAYSKLDVAQRGKAVAKARKLGLI